MIEAQPQPLSLNPRVFLLVCLLTVCFPLDFRWIFFLSLLSPSRVLFRRLIPRIRLRIGRCRPQVPRAKHCQWPGIDLFPTRLNKQLLVYVSPCPDPQAFDTDTLSMDWDILLFLYLFPPSPILPVVVQKVKQSDNTFLVIAPLWPHQSWYLDLISLSPWIIPCVSHRGKIFWFRTFPRGFGFTPTRVCSNTMLGCCPGAPPNSRFFGEHCGPDCLASERLHRTPLQCQVGRVLSLVPSTESRSCLSRCALSGRVLGAFVPENDPVGYRYY